VKVRVPFSWRGTHFLPGETAELSAEAVALYGNVDFIDVSTKVEKQAAAEVEEKQAEPPAAPVTSSKKR
jgi:hypothetical protein